MPFELKDLVIPGVGLVSSVWGALIGAWVTRKNASEGAVQTFLRSAMDRIKDNEASIVSLENRNDELREAFAKKDEEWMKERREKHEALNQAQEYLVRYEHDIGVMKEAHTREIAEMREAHTREIASLKECYEKELAELRQQIALLAKDLEHMRAQTGIGGE
jgi:septal ring factor EnvC (AmiA/AmiB activator)